MKLGIYPCLHRLHTQRSIWEFLSYLVSFGLLVLWRPCWNLIGSTMFLHCFVAYRDSLFHWQVWQQGKSSGNLNIRKNRSFKHYLIVKYKDNKHIRPRDFSLQWYDTSSSQWFGTDIFYLICLCLEFTVPKQWKFLKLRSTKFFYSFALLIYINSKQTVKLCGFPVICLDAHLLCLYRHSYTILLMSCLTVYTITVNSWFYWCPVSLSMSLQYIVDAIDVLYHCLHHYSI